MEVGNLRLNRSRTRSKTELCLEIGPWKPLTYYIYPQIFSTHSNWSQKWPLEPLNRWKSTNWWKSPISDTGHMLQLTAQTVMKMAITHTGKIFQLIWHYAYRTHIPAYCSDPGGEDHHTYRACVSAHCWNCDESDHHTHRSHLAAYLTSCIQVTHSSLLLRS